MARNQNDTISEALKHQDSISLVFASHKRPGGGWKRHKKGQEEYIARRTNLVERLQPYLHLYGDNKKPFYIMLSEVRVKKPRAKRDFIVSHAPVAHLYTDPVQELEKRIKKICELVKDYPVFITGAFGCGFFHNKLEDTRRFFKVYATNPTVIMAIK